MTFMQPEITDRQSWVEIDGDMGTEWIAVDMVGTLPDYDAFDDDDAYAEALLSAVSDYCENRKAHRIEIVEGFGARLSAPGYMDATEFAVFPTEIEALEYLLDTYADESDDWHAEVLDRVRELNPQHPLLSFWA